MKQSEYTHASIVPLIGGEPLGLQASLGDKNPEYVLSYSPFTKNDSHYINYLRTKKNWGGDYILLDENEHHKASYVDIVSAVCPCAGLSSLSVSSSEYSPTNDWMYLSAEYVLEHIKPRVFFGENAPRLFTKKGEAVANRLHEIGLKNGYSLPLYSTSSKEHGLAQKRPRTFYFFTKDSSKAPYFKTYNKPLIYPVEEVLQKTRSKDDPMNVLINRDDPYDSPWLKYVLHMTNNKTLLDLHNYIDNTVNLINYSEKLCEKNLNLVAEWFDQQGPEVVPSKFADRARAMQAKLDDNKGYWSHGVTVPKNLIPALIGAQPASLMNPFKDSFLTLRDALEIMTMPDDFSLHFDPETENPVKYTNHICQNVPHNVARDMGEAIIEYLNAEDNGSYDHYENGVSLLRQKNQASDLHQTKTAPIDTFF